MFLFCGFSRSCSSKTTAPAPLCQQSLPIPGATRIPPSTRGTLPAAQGKPSHQEGIPLRVIRSLLRFRGHRRIYWRAFNVDRPNRLRTASPEPYDRLSRATMAGTELDEFKNVIRRNLENSGTLDRARGILRVRASGFLGLRTTAVERACSALTP